MKKLFLLTILLFTFTVGFTQLTTINPDTVCVNTPGSIYQVANTAGYTYTWVVSAPGIITSGQGTNQINVDWSAATPGLITGAVSVTATNGTGCTSTPVTLDVYILQLQPSITAIGPFCENASCVNLTGTPAGGVWAGTGVVGSQFCPNTAGVGTHNISYTVSLGGCVFTTTSTIIVTPVPVLTPISHN